MTPAPTTKRDAALAAQRAEAQASNPTVCTDTSGARIRTVGVHLTNFAPGLEGLAIDNRRRWPTLWGYSPLRALKATLKRLNRSPRAVSVLADEAGVNLLARPTLVTLGKADRDDGLVPFATFWDGLTEAEVRDALKELVAAGWEPPSPTPSNL